MFFKCVIKSQPLQYQLQMQKRKESHTILPLKFFLKVPTHICMFGLYLSADEV